VRVSRFLTWFPRLAKEGIKGWFAPDDVGQCDALFRDLGSRRHRTALDEEPPLNPLLEKEGKGEW